MISSKVGSPVTGEDFFDREDEQRQMWEYLGGDDLLLLAPRRVGKTPGVLKRLRKGPVGRFFKRIRKVSLFEFGLELGEGDPWEEVGAALAAALDQPQGQRLILMDEVPVFVLSLLRKDPAGDRARRFLAWFRDLRQQPDRRGGLRWLLAGSIGLDTVASRLRFGDTINDLYLVRLGSFERETARRFLHEMSAAYDFPIADLLSPSKKGYFDYWRQRLEEELGQPDAGLALLILNAAAEDPKGAPRTALNQALAQRIQDPVAKDDRLRYLIDVLENDGYLVEQGRRYRFRSPLLREFWLRRVVP